MIKGAGNMNRIWFMLKVIHNSKNKVQHLNIMHEWLRRLNGVDGLVESEAKNSEYKIIKDIEYVYYCDEISFEIPIVKKRELKMIEKQIELNSRGI